MGNCNSRNEVIHNQISKQLGYTPFYINDEGVGELSQLNCGDLLSLESNDCFSNPDNTIQHRVTLEFHTAKQFFTENLKKILDLEFSAKKTNNFFYDMCSPPKGTETIKLQCACTYTRAIDIENVIRNAKEESEELILPKDIRVIGGIYIPTLLRITYIDKKGGETYEQKVPDSDLRFAVDLYEIKK